MPLFTRINPDQTEVKLRGESLSRLNRVIDYIHRHQMEALHLEKMAEISCMSLFHFHRQFKLVMGETPIQFIRRIRLEKAAHKLMLEQYKPITEIAHEYGFSSSQNFSRSFKSQFNVSPTMMRDTFNWYDVIDTIQQIKRGMTIEHINSLLFLEQFVKNRNLTLREILKETPPDDVKIKTLPPCRVAYIRTVGAAYSYEAVKPAIYHIIQWALPRALIHEGTYLRGIAWNNPDLTPADKLIYDVCIEVPKNVKADRWVSVQTLPGGEHAAYRSLAEVRQHENQNEFMRLFYWLFFSEYRAEAPPYLNTYFNMAENHPKGLADIELCIPVKPIKE